MSSRRWLERLTANAKDCKSPHPFARSEFRSNRHPGHDDPDPADPDRYQLKADEKVDKVNFFQENSVCRAINT